MLLEYAKSNGKCTSHGRPEQAIHEVETAVLSH